MRLGIVKILAFGAVIAAVCGMTGCKPSEKNWRAAYERTVAARENEKEDSIIYTSQRRDVSRRQMAVNGDTIAVQSQYVAITKDGGGIRESIKRYCVVAGQFKQVFNARSMRERLVDEGYPGAFVVHNGEPYYFVIAGAFDEAAPAMQLAEKLKKDKSLQLKSPLPYILQPSQIR